jgi:hypothetical protein
MIKDIVMCKFKSDVAAADKLEMKRQLEALMGAVLTLADISVGMDVSRKDRPGALCSIPCLIQWKTLRPMRLTHST